MLDPNTVRNILSRMQVEDPDYRVFGSAMHKYRLGPPVSESELAVFEAKYELRLPEDYRDFLKYVGNGNGTISDRKVIGINAGAGPYYGMLPFAEVHYDCRPQQPFPLGLEGNDPKGVCLFDDVDDATATDEDYEFPGMIQICYEGCNNFCNLVIKGESYGTLWETWDYNVCVTGWTFEHWYSNWLYHLVETAIPLLHRERVVAQVRVGMTKDEVVEICGGEGTARDFGTGTRFAFLSFPHLITEFQVDEEDRVTRIVKHSKSLPRLPVLLLP